MVRRARLDSAVGLIVNQEVDRGKLARAKALRHESTLAERILWQQLRGNQLADLHFRRQQLIDSFIVDFYCHPARLAIEVDGDVHLQQVEYDGDRSRVFAARGIRILRVTNEQVIRDVESVLALIRLAAQQSIQTATGHDPENSSPLPGAGRGTGG